MSKASMKGIKIYQKDTRQMRKKRSKEVERNRRNHENLIKNNKINETEKEKNSIQKFRTRKEVKKRRKKLKN